MADSPRDLDETTAAARIADGTAWREFCRALGAAGELVLARAPDHPVDRAEGLRYVTRLARMAFKLSLEHGDPAAPARAHGIYAHLGLQATNYDVMETVFRGPASHREA